MALPVVTVASGGMPVVDVTGTVPLMGRPVTEATNGRGMAVTKVASRGMPVTFTTIEPWPPAGGAPPIWARVQGKKDTSGSGTSKAVTLTAAVTNGNILVGGVLLNVDAVLSGVTDDKGNAYRVVNSGHQPVGGALSVSGFRSVNPITNGAQTLTFTYQTSSLAWIVIDEFTAGTPLAAVSLDGSQLAVNVVTASTPVFLTSQSDDLLYDANFNSSNTTTGAGWTAGQGSGTQQMSQWKQAVSPGLLNAVFGTTGTSWSTVFAVAARARTGWELRQNQMQRSANATTTGAVSFTTPVASGSMVIGGIAVGTNGHIADIISITDDKGNNYPIIPGYIDAVGRAIFWSGTAPLTNGPTTITCTTSISESVVYLLAAEFLPPPGKTVFAIDGTPVMTSPTGAGPYSSTSITTTQAGDLVYGFIDNAQSGSVPNNGFSTLNGYGQTWCDAYQVQQSAGAVNSQWVGNGGPVNALSLVAIKAS